MSTKQERLRALVLTKDLEQANKLTDCMLQYMNNALMAETSEGYNRWCDEFDRCAHELLMLRKEREKHEASKKYSVAVRSLQAKGANASLVSRK